LCERTKSLSVRRIRGLTFCCGGERVGTIAAKADANPADHAESNGLTALTSDSYTTVPSILVTAMFDLFCFTTSYSRRTKGVWDVGIVRETLVLRDGRKLTYFLDGPLLHRERLPHIFVFHAMCLSGNSFLMTNAPQDFIMVCVNRPGYFGSDPPSAPTYRYASFAEDIEQLADALEVDSNFVAGHSSGGPCALACAAFSSDRVRAIGILAGDPEYAHPMVPNKKQSSVILLGHDVLPFLLNWVLWCLPPARKTRDGLVNDYRLETTIYIPFALRIFAKLLLSLWAPPMPLYHGRFRDTYTSDYRMRH
jgi:pimeloyl-ACP methyl ester carboxylesterase